MYPNSNLRFSSGNVWARTTIKMLIVQWIILICRELDPISVKQHLLKSTIQNYKALYLKTKASSTFNER